MRVVVRGAQRPGVVLVALRQLPDAGVAGGARRDALRARRSGGRAPGAILSDASLRRLRREVARQCLRTSSRTRSTIGQFATLPPRASLIWASVLSSRKSGAMTPCAAAALQAPGLAVELAGVGLEPREVGIRVLLRRDGVLLVEQARDLEEGARVLRDDVGRVPPRPVLVEQSRRRRTERRSPRRRSRAPCARRRDRCAPPRRVRPRPRLSCAQAGQPRAARWPPAPPPSGR